MLAFNEGKVCEAIIRHLEAREQQTRADVQSPESINHSDPVELTWRFGTQLYALEHTGIEPFEGHLRMDAEAERHFRPIEVALKDTLPPDIFELQVPAKAMLGRKKAEVAQIQTALIEWVRCTAPTLKIRPYADYGRHNPWLSVPGVPFGVRLYRFETLPQIGGWFHFTHLVSGNREQERTDRIRRTCDAKFPKLAAWKRDHGAKTILVLEDNDVQLTNNVIVAEAYLPLALGRGDRPDETYLVATCMDTWIAWPILIDGKTMYELSEDDYLPRWQIDHTTLTSATSR